jgi:hypothetical protein
LRKTSSRKLSGLSPHAGSDVRASWSKRVVHVFGLRSGELQNHPFICDDTRSAWPVVCKQAVACGHKKKDELNASIRMMSKTYATGRPTVILYFLALSVTVTGWLRTISIPLVDPITGIGYWLGIAGGSMMLLLLFYPIRKRVRALGFLGKTKYWFQLHMALGVAGPILILFHCNFRLGSVNSTMALVCTLTVAVSGLIGRFVHSRIFSDLSGHRILLSDLVDTSADELAAESETTTLLPRLHERAAELQRETLDELARVTPSLTGMLARKWRMRAESRRLKRVVRDWLRQSQSISGVERRRHRITAYDFIEKNLTAVRRIYELSVYERLFGLWHVLHLPFFYMLVVTASIHVLAVHMY